MRQIKFRGKRTDNGEWVYGSLIHDIENDVFDIFCFDYSGHHAYEVIPESVGQFTAEVFQLSLK